jgi:Holliday junction resolvasome RuvABC endonuclease subunit
MHGIVFLAAEVSKATVSTVMPQEWKKKCLGNGHLKKESVANFFKSIYKQSKYGQDAIDSFFICQYKLLEQYGAKANKFNYVFI